MIPPVFNECTWSRFPAAGRAQFLSPKNNPVINVTNNRKLGEEKGNSPNRIRNSHREKINRRRQKEEKDILCV